MFIRYRENAIRYFREALEETVRRPDSEDNIRLKSCIHAQIAGLYLESALYRNAIFHFKKEIDLDIQLKEFDWALITYLHLTNLYRWLAENDSAKMMRQKAATLLPLATSPKTQNIFQTQTIVALMKDGDYAAADSIMNRYSLLQDSLLGISELQIINNLEWLKGNTESVKEKSLKLMEIGDIYRKRKAAEYLSRIFLEEQNINESMRYLLLFIRLSD